MATAITPQFGNANCPQLRLTVTITSDTASQAVLSWSLDYVAHGYAASTSVAKSYTAVIAGQTVASGSTSINGVTGTKNIDSGTKTITKTNSNQTISFSCSMAFNLTWGGTYGGTKSGSGSITVGGKTTYTISYNANGGSGAPSSQTKFHGTAITLSNSTPSRSGYIFQGWATSSSGSVQYQPGDSYTANASVTLYAVWSTTGYTVSYNANGGSGAPGNQTKQHGVTLTLSSVIPTRSNYTFKGWGTSAASTTVAYSPGGSYTKNASITLYAIWEVSYNAPGITNVTADRCTSSGTLDEEGTYGRVTFDWSTETSATSARIYYKLQTTSSWTTATTITISGTSGSVDRTIGGSFDVETAYDVRVSVYDSGGSSYYDTTLPAMSYILDFLKGGKGVAIGGPSSKAGFEVVMDTSLKGGVGIGTDAPTDGTLNVQVGSEFHKEVEIWAGLRGVIGNIGIPSNGQLGFSTSSSFYPFLEKKSGYNDRPLFISHPVLDNQIYLQAATSSGGASNILRMNSEDKLELYWPSGGIQGRMFQSLYSGSVSIGGSFTVSNAIYYRLYAMRVSGVNALLIGARQSPDSTVLTDQRVMFFDLYASTSAWGGHFVTCDFTSNTRLTYTAGKNVSFTTGTASNLGTITQVWGIL